MIKKIAIVGPESTGKSQLAQQLAAHFNTEWIPEIARTFLQQQNNLYTLQDLDTIAELQFQAIKNVSDENLVFIDTEMYVMKIWSEIKYGLCSSTILQLLARQPIDAFLLLDIDLPWSEDPQREDPHPEDRQKLMQYYVEHIANDGKPFALISGKDQHRLDMAVAVVEGWNDSFKVGLKSNLDVADNLG